MPQLRLRLASVLLALTSAPAAAERLELDHGGAKRSYELFEPDARAARPLPAMLVLHGGGSSASQMRHYTGFDRLAGREGIVAVYPDAIRRQWNDGRPGTPAADDVGFLVALVDRLAARGLVDPARVYAAGISNGGIMAMRLACEQAGRIAGIAVVAANAPVGYDCRPTRAVPAVFFHGTDDALMPFAGGRVAPRATPSRGTVVSVRDTTALWARANGCADPITVRLPPRARDETTVDLTTFRRCSGAPVAAYAVIKGGHTWPGTDQGFVGDWILGVATRQIDANEALWTFFRSAARR